MKIRIIVGKKDLQGVPDALRVLADSLQRKDEHRLFIKPGMCEYEYFLGPDGGSCGISYLGKLPEKATP